VSALNIFGGQGNETYTVYDTPSTAVTTISSSGKSTSNVNVLGTAGELDLIGGHGNTVNIGTISPSPGWGKTDGIDGVVKVSGGTFTRVNVNDSAYPDPRTAVLRTAADTQDTWGSVETLSPAPILYSYSDTASLTVSTGNDAVVNVFETRIPTDLEASAPNTTVTLSRGGSVQGIRGTLFVSNSVPVAVNLTLDDSADPTSRTVIMMAGEVVGLAPAPVYYGSGEFDPLNTLTVKGGTGGNQFQVESTTTPMKLADGTVVSTVTNILSNGPDTVFVGYNDSVQNIQGILNIDKRRGAFTQVYISDYMSPTARPATLNQFTQPDGSAWGSLTDLAPAAINWRDAGTSRVDIQTNASSTVNVLDTGNVPTFVNGIAF
jgi:hypothetical protein